MLETRSLKQAEPASSLPVTHYHTCCLCEAMCGLEIVTQGETVLSIKGDQQDVFSKGHICPKGVALQDLHTDPDRLRQPIKRVGDSWEPISWEPISWEAALSEIGKRLAHIQKQHGRDSVAMYMGNPFAHNYAGLLAMPLVWQVLGSRNRYSASSLDQMPLMLAALLMFGHQLLMPLPDIGRTHYLLMLGANPLVSNGSLMAAPDLRNQIKGIKARGGKFVLIDPRRTETAALADEHHFLRPGADALLLLGLLHTVFAEGLARPGRLSKHLQGLDTIQTLVMDFSPETVAAATGMSAETIRRLAREFCQAPSAVAYGRLGTCAQEFGTLASWLIIVLNAVTGRLDTPGGSMFPTPAADLVALSNALGMQGHFGKHRSRVRGLPDFGGEFPSVALAEEIATPGPGQIKALITVAGNPVLSTPNGEKLESALDRLELMVAIDIYCNETSSKADYILPPASQLEREHFDLVGALLAPHNHIKYSPPVFAKAPDARHDWQILTELALSVASAQGLPKAALDGIYKLYAKSGPSGTVDALLRLGPYGDRYNPFSQGLNLSKLKRHPHGLDLGPMQPSLPGRLATPQKRIRLAPPEFLRDLRRLRAKLEAPIPAFVLIGRRQLRSNNSWMHNQARLVKGRNPCTLLMHPEDASRLGLRTGDFARLRSRVGELLVPVELSDSMMPGVVSLPHGWGHHRRGNRLGVATAQAGVSINDITDETFFDQLSGNAGLSGLPVEVEKEGRGARDAGFD